MATIQAAHYAEARNKLMTDPIIQDMVVGLEAVSLDALQHDDGTPRFEFMQVANAEYDKRGGTYKAHLGAVPEALLALLKKESSVDTDTKTVTTLKTITFELVKDGVFYDVEVKVAKADFDQALGEIMGMRSSRNIQY